MANVSFTMDGEETVRKKLDELEGRIKDKTTLHKLWALGVYKWTMENFQSEGQKTGQKWVALASVTTEKRIKKSSTILQDKGHLRQSFVPRWDNSNASVGSNVIYSAIHQKGGKAGRNKKVNIPKRPMLPEKYSLIEKDIDKLTMEYLKYGK